MHLSYLLHRHQVSLIRAEAGACIEARLAHRAFAKHYARQFDGFRATRTASGVAPRRLTTARGERP